MFIIVGVILILSGAVAIYAKYRVVIGGTIYKAEVIRCEYLSRSKGITQYKYIMGFTCDDKYLEIPSLNSTSSPEKNIGKRFFIHYNYKHPQYVVNRSVGIDLIFLSFIVFGLLALFE